MISIGAAAKTMAADGFIAAGRKRKLLSLGRDTGFDLTALGSWTLGGAIEANLESDSLKAISAKASL